MPCVMSAIGITLGIAIAATALLVSGRVRGDVVGLLVAASLALAGVIPAKEVLNGLGNPVIGVLLAVFVLTKGLELTGVTDTLGRVLTRWAGGSERRLLAMTFGMAALLSLFMNTMAAAAVLIPPVAALARRDPRFSLRKVLIPLAFGTLLGGTATLLTTANLVTSAALEAHGYAPYGVLDFLPVGLPLVVVGGLFMVLVAPRLLPNGQAQGEEAGARWALHDLGEVYPLAEGLHLLRLREDSPLVGRPARRPGLARELGWTPVALLRDKRAYPMARIPQRWRLRPGDIWLVGGRVSAEALAQYGLERASADALVPLVHEQAALAEVTLNPHGAAVGKTPQDLRLRQDYGVMVLMIWRNGRVLMEEVHRQVLQAGDALLLHGPPGQLQRLIEKEDFALLAQVGLRPPRNRARATAAVAAMLIALLPAVLGWLPLSLSALLGMLWAMVTGVIEPEQAYQSVSWPAIFLVAGMIPLAQAMQRTGAAALVSEAMLRPLGSQAPAWAVAGVFLVLTVALTQIVSGQAAAIILAPLAIAAAEHHGLNPRGVAMAVAVGASLAFLLPTAHPANLLVMGPGRYEPKDYLRVGLPLTLVVLPVALLVLQWVWL